MSSLHRWLVSACCLLATLAWAERVRADDLQLAFGLEAGAAWTYRSHDYTSWEEPPSSSDDGNANMFGPSGALHFELTGALGGGVRLGGVLRTSFTGVPSPFHAEMGPQLALAVGPVLRIEPADAMPGPYCAIWAGFATAIFDGHGFAGGLEGGYVWPLSDEWSFTLGGSVSTQLFFASEAGDFGDYEYFQASVISSIHVRFAYAL